MIAVLRHLALAARSFMETAAAYALTKPKPNLCPQGDDIFLFFLVGYLSSRNGYFWSKLIEVGLFGINQAWFG